MRTHEQNERTSPYHPAFETFLQGNDGCHCADYGDGHLHTDLYADVEGDTTVMPQNVNYHNLFARSLPRRFAYLLSMRRSLWPVTELI